MSRPLLITDCDEVLLHMVVPFQSWLESEKHIDFDLAKDSFIEALRHKHDGTLVPQDDIWPLLDEFFGTEMDRQMPIAGAVESVNAIAEFADVVVLTNLLDKRRDARAEQLRAVGIDFPVYTNQGGKGRPLAEIVEKYQPSAVLFVDDLEHHHGSVAEHAPATWRVHMVGEPQVAQRVAPAPHAHVRIDNWAEARPWIEQRLREGRPADILEEQR